MPPTSAHAPAAATGIRWLLVDAVLLVAFIAITGTFSIWLGQDVNWDLQNYHYYNAWAWVHDRRGYAWDIVAAQLQTYHNPLLDLPFYYMVEGGLEPRTIAFVQAIPAGIGAFFLLKMLQWLFRGMPAGQRWIAIACAFAVGTTSAMGLGVIGTTMNEWPGAALTIAGIYFIVRALAQSPGARVPRRALIIAGLLLGFATGGKFTCGVYAVGLCAALFWREPFRPKFWWRSTSEAFVFGLAVLAGTAITAGPWMWALWTQFQNPIFPYGNIWIKSPWWGLYEAMGRPYGPHKFGDWFPFPFTLAAPRAFYVAEVSYVDARVPVLYGLALLAGAAYLVQRFGARVAGRVEPPASDAEIWRVLGVFWAVSFLLWTAQYSIYRYTIPLQMLTGALLVALLRHLMRPIVAGTATVMLSAALVGSTSIPDWWHIDFGPEWFAVDMTKPDPNALVLLTSNAPMAYVLPFFPPDAKHLGINNTISDAKRKTLMEDEIQRTIREHKGPIYSLSYPAGDGVDALLERRLLKITQTCLPIVTNMRTSPLEMCRVVRMPDP